MKTAERTSMTGASLPAVLPAPGTHLHSDEHRSDGRTREAVVQLLLATGPLTAVALAEHLGLSTAGVRRHLEALLEDGSVTTRESNPRARRGRGRPARVFLLTDAGRAQMPHAYDQLAVQALDYLEQTAGPEAVSAFARQRAEAVIAPYRARLDAAKDLPAKLDLLADALTDGGFAASVEKVGIGEQLCQHHCPVGHVAARHPQLCEEELAVFTAELGTYAQRLATIASGDAYCTTFIPAAALAAHRDHPDPPSLSKQSLSKQSPSKHSPPDQ